MYQKLGYLEVVKEAAEEYMIRAVREVKASHDYVTNGGEVSFVFETLFLLLYSSGLLLMLNTILPLMLFTLLFHV